jgi:hypothetical protein
MDTPNGKTESRTSLSRPSPIQGTNVLLTKPVVIQPNPVGNGYIPDNAPAIGDLMNLFYFENDNGNGNGNGNG